MADSLSDDEYAAFDFSEFTEEDFKEIDQQLAHPAGPEVTVELDSPSVEFSTGTRPNETVWATQSPLSQFRREGILSVTDLSALAWCEVQFDYGLRQQRSRPIAARPPSFVSKQGKTISVETATAVQNDKIQAKGKAVHKELENEIPMQEVEVVVSYPEERWALRLVNMMASIHCLLDYGIAREMPVFGLINGVMVLGIIDEITREPMKPKSAAKGSPKKQTTPPPSQARITEFLSPSKQDTALPDAPLQNSPRLYTHTLHISDAKTRRTNNLPSHPDTLPARIQVMLYRRLLNDLISPSYEFTLLWNYLELEPTRKLSDRFLMSSGLLWMDPSVTCLDDIGHLWARVASQLNVPEVDPNLKLVYRLQPKGMPKSAGRSRGRTPDLVSIQEDLDLKAAIEASLREVSGRGAANATNEAEGVITALPSEQDLTVSPNNNSTDQATPEQPQTPHTGQIIGTKKFVYKEDFLDTYLTRALEWWLGQREPEGVSLDDSRRCFSCEYAEDCEWREQKAVEFRDHMLEKRRNAT